MLLTHYLFPYSNDKELWNQADYRIIVDTIDGIVRKIYHSQNDTLQSGMFLFNQEKLSSSDKLSLTTNNKIPFKKLVKILKTVELASEKQ